MSMIQIREHIGPTLSCDPIQSSDALCLLAAAQYDMGKGIFTVCQNINVIATLVIQTETYLDLLDLRLIVIKVGTFPQLSMSIPRQDYLDSRSLFLPYLLWPSRAKPIPRSGRPVLPAME
jgi:hypothetical protein